MGNQGAGAFLALAAISIWMSRRHLRHVLRAAVGLGRVEGEEREALSSRMAVLGFVLSFGGVLYLCWAAGLNLLRPMQGSHSFHRLGHQEEKVELIRLRLNI